MKVSLALIKKPDGTKWKPTKLDYYTHEKIRLEKSLEEYKIKMLKTGGAFPNLTNKIIQKYERKIKDLTAKIQIEGMKQR